MARYMLDTDTVSHALRGYGHAGERLLALNPSDVCMSALTLSELRYGADLRGSRKLHRLIEAFASGVDTVPFDAECAGLYGRVASLLDKKGTPIGVFDALIAAHALSLDVTLVTNNTRHFTRVDGLRTENWTHPAT